MKALLVLFLAAAGASGCRTRPVPPPIPSGVPAAASFVGGADGGVFVHCRPLKAARRFHCRVWRDFDGELAAAGTFAATTGANLADPAELDGWDGARLLLRGGGVAEVEGP